MSNLRSTILTTALMLVAPTLAAAPAQPAGVQPTSFFAELISIVLPLAFIILGLFAVLHFARRRYGMTGQDAPLSVVQVLPLGPRERIVLVKTRTGRVFAIGVAGQSVNLITDLDPAELVPNASEPVSHQTPKLFAMPLILRDLGRRRSPPPNSDG